MNKENIEELVLYIISQFDNGIESKIKIQKIMYFFSIILDYNLKFYSHFYGPYSSILEETIGHLYSNGFLDRYLITSIPYEKRCYKYVISKDGKEFLTDLYITGYFTNEKYKSFFHKLDKLIDIFKVELNNPTYKELTIASKIYHILEFNNMIINNENIIKTSKNINLKFDELDLRKAIKIINKIKELKKVSNTNSKKKIFKGDKT